MNEEPHAAASAEETPLAFDEIVDRAGRRITTGLIVAGALIGLGIYWQQGPPRYQMVANGNQILRIDMRKGTIIGCEGGRCATILRHGDHLSPRLSIEASPKQPAAPAPAPAATPAAR